MEPDSAERRHEGHGNAARPAPWLRHDITLAESVVFLWYLRHVSVVGDLHGLPERAALLKERPGKTAPEGRQFIYASTWRRILERIDVEWVKGHATMQHVREGTISLWQLQANEPADELAKKGSAVHPCVKQF